MGENSLPIKKNMNPEVKKFIENNIKLVDTGNYHELYSKAFLELSIKQLLELEEVFLTAEVPEAKLSNYIDLRKIL